jgi:hypothetical protein
MTLWTDSQWNGGLAPLSSPTGNLRVFCYFLKFG